MGLGATLIRFSPDSDIRSSDMNSNFGAINAVSVFSGTAQWASQGYSLQTNGGKPAVSMDANGNVTFSQGAPQDASGNRYQTFVRCNGFNTGTFSHGYHGTPDSIFPVVDSTNNAEGLGIDTMTATTFHLNMPTAYSWQCVSSQSQ